MHDRLAAALSRTSIRIVLAVVLTASIVTAGAWAADFVGTQSAAETPAPTASETAASPAATTGDAADGSDVGFKLNGGGGKNIVKITNRTDNRLIVRGRVDFNRIPAPKVAPVNAAIAVASCSGCQTYAVALQINLYQRGASTVAPQNAAAAVNAACSHCVTVARSIQYAIPVDDVSTIPHDVRELAKALDKELHAVEGVYDTSSFNVYDANARINNVVTQFKTLANSLLDEYRVATESNSPTPAPAASGAAIDPNATDTPPEGSCAPTASPDSSPTASGASPGPPDCASDAPASSAAPSDAAPPDAAPPDAAASPAP
jgi:putative peptide zinc metalloprotease protein